MGVGAWRARRAGGGWQAARRSVQGRRDERGSMRAARLDRTAPRLPRVPLPLCWRPHLRSVRSRPPWSRYLSRLARWLRTMSHSRRNSVVRLYARQKPQARPAAMAYSPSSRELLRRMSSTLLRTVAGVGGEWVGGWEVRGEKWRTEEEAGQACRGRAAGQFRRAHPHCPLPHPPHPAPQNTPKQRPSPVRTGTSPTGT